jgi:hypothetical protein
MMELINAVRGLIDNGWIVACPELDDLLIGAEQESLRADAFFRGRELVKAEDAELRAEVTRLQAQHEADARAFVALPALIDLLREAATDEYGDTERYLGRDWLTKARAALAQADGPAPTEE